MTFCARRLVTSPWEVGIGDELQHGASGDERAPWPPSRPRGTKVPGRGAPGAGGAAEVRQRGAGTGTPTITRTTSESTWTERSGSTARWSPSPMPRLSRACAASSNGHRQAAARAARRCRASTSAMRSRMRRLRSSRAARSSGCWRQRAANSASSADQSGSPSRASAQTSRARSASSREAAPSKAPIDGLGDLGVDGVEHRQAEVVLAGEVRVDGPLGEPGLLGHPLQRRGGVPVGEEQRARRRHEPQPGLRLALGAADARRG